MRVGRTRLFLVLATVLSLIGTTSADAANRMGGSCSKPGARATIKGTPAVCKKVGTKWVWKALPRVRKPVTSTATPAPVPLPAPTSVNDQIGKGDLPIYATTEGRLERLVGGRFFSSDSRPDSAFSSVRLAAYRALQARRPVFNHPNVAITYDISESFPKPLADYVRAAIEREFSLWNDVFVGVVPVDVRLMTEKDLDRLSPAMDPFGDSRSVLQRLRDLDLSRERSFISGGGGYRRVNGSLRGTIFLATKSTTTTDRMNFEWPYVPSHEVMHVVQEYLAHPMDSASDAEYQRRFPVSLIEGSATTVGFLTAPNLGWASDTMNYASREWGRGYVMNSTDDVIEFLVRVETRHPYPLFGMSYILGGTFYEWLIGTYGLEKFLTLLRQTSKHSDFDASVRTVFGMSKTQLYAAAAPYILETWNRATQ